MKPILFSTEMVKAILAGNKTMTRRVVPERIVDKYYEYEDFCNAVSCPEINGQRESEHDFYLKRVKYRVGDILYVRETWGIGIQLAGTVVYRADYVGKKAPLAEGQKWKPSMFMPKELARIFLRVTDVRTERLNHISEADAIEEGVLSVMYEYAKPLYAFEKLWDRINGERPGCSWADNPWVWIYEFERIEK